MPTPSEFKTASYVAHGSQRDYVPMGWSLRNVTTWLIIVNVVVYILDEWLITQGYFERRFIIIQDSHGIAHWRHIPIGILNHWGHFSASSTLDGHQWWRLLTFQFLHGGVMHLLMNMIGLYFMAPVIEAYLGRIRFLLFYLFCGIMGGATYLLLWKLEVLEYAANTPLVGASAGVFGVLAAVARLAPNAVVQLLFPPVPVRMKELALVLLAVAALTVLTHEQNAGGEAGHLGGGVIGFLVVRWFAPRRKILRQTL